MTEVQSSHEIERQGRWLMTLRVVIVTTLLVSSYAVEVLFRPGETLEPLFMITAVAYGMALAYGLLDRWLRGRRAFVAMQLVGDACVVTLFVGITGGLDSPMSFLYLLPISVAAMLLYRRGGLALAAICWLLYAGLVVFGHAWPLLGTHGVAPLAHEPGRAIYFLVAHLVAMIAFALLASYLSERLRTQGRELAERRGAVARLKALNENIIESINSGLITTALDGRVNFMNRGGGEILGLAPEEVDGVGVDALFGLDGGFLDEIRARLRANLRFRFERFHDTGDGRRIFLGVAASNLHDKQGLPLGYIFIFQDLTEIHALEQEMRLKERMVALGEMAAGIAHELRNPLAAISGAVQYLKGDLRPTGETLELMDIILRESQRLDQAIRDFLTFARPGTFTPESADLAKVIDDSVKLLRKSREFREGHRIETRYFAPRIDCEIDANRMKQVFWNLATNALKSMPRGGLLTIGVETAEAGRQLVVSFVDQGQGMDPAVRDSYFQPFSGKFVEGTGLGAAIVYRLVEEHGGKIQLASEPGSGTSVHITLPRYCRQAAPAAVDMALAAAAGG